MDEILEARCDCGHFPSEHGPHTTGYGKDAAGKTWCWGCCAERDREQMRREGRISLYVTRLVENPRQRIHEPSPPPKGCEIVNWPGTLVFQPLEIRVGTHCCFGGRQRRLDVWFIFEERVWHGMSRGDNNEVLRCRRTKELWKPSGFFHTHPTYNNGYSVPWGPYKVRGVDPWADLTLGV